MDFIFWRRERNRPPDQPLPPGTFIEVTGDDGQPAGAVLVLDDRARGAVLEYANGGRHGTGLWRMSDLVIDQISSISPLVLSALTAGQMVEIVGSSAVLAGLNSGQYTLMPVAGAMTGTAISKTTGQIVGQMQFVPAGVGAILAPVVLWQILHSVAGVRQLAQINMQLQLINRRLDELVLRLQVSTYGPLAAARACLEDWMKQYYMINRVT